MSRKTPISIRDRTSFGGWVAIGDPLSAEIMARAGYDWLLLDAQHGGVHPGNLLGLLQAVELGGIPAFVRVSANDPAEIMRALDLGAAGIVVPMVSTTQEARAAAAAVHYPPAGNRSFGKLRYFQTADCIVADPLCFVMIETAAALDNLDAVAATPGVDGLFVGPADLGLAMGFTPGAQVPDAVMAAIGKIVTACRRHGLIPGGASFGPDNAQAQLQLGMRFLTLGADAGLLRRGAAAEVARAREWPA